MKSNNLSIFGRISMLSGFAVLILSLLISLFSPIATPAAAAPVQNNAGQCDPRGEQTSNYSISRLADGTVVVTFSEPGWYCVKAGNDNTGWIYGTVITYNFLNNGGQIPDVSHA
ncbi:MAG TPA: hypothetical protein PKD55_21345, partial [Bellilinea sp.]|nr:hypothetical protein [Bellilinea sp.]